jgi:hypothetical protein
VGALARAADQGERIKKRRGFTTEDTKNTKEGKGIKKPLSLPL